VLCFRNPVAGETLTSLPVCRAGKCSTFFTCIPYITNRMKRILQLAGVFFILFIVITLGLKSTFDGYYGFYYEEGEYKKPWAYTATESVIQSFPVNIFIAYTGFDTGYGFFAPNVASDFVLLFEIKDSLGQTIGQSAMPRFRQKESSVRYTSLYNMFLDKISKQEQKENNQYMQYLDIVIRQIALKVKKDYPAGAVVHAKLYLYDYPSLQRYRKGDHKERAVLISEYKI
jgi:hypothetical protein